MEERVYNFSPGPAALPQEVIKKVQQELQNYNHHGYSILELSHRSKDFINIIENCKKKLLDLLELPNNYHPVFLQGGATTEFFRVAYNLLGEGKTADYIETGTWVKKAIQEAQNISPVQIIASSKDKNFNYIPEENTLNFTPNAEYVYLCSNNTIVGTQYKTYPKPQHGNYLVGDFTSDILSRKCDLSDFGIIFAGAQKNLAPAGLSVAIIRDDVLKKCNPKLLGINSYITMHKDNSLFNTSPVFPIYFMDLVLDWIYDQGGVEALEKINEEKAAMLYEVIDQESIYTPTANKANRSVMNITFTLPDDDITNKFIEQAKENGLANLKGHRSVGGIRVSNYNAMPLEGIVKLTKFMKDFSSKN